MKKLALSIISLTGLLALTGCGETISYKPYVVVEKKCPTKIYVDEPGLVLFKDETAQIHTNVRPLNASNADIVYESSNPNVASVSEGGIVTGVGSGVADIRVYAKEDPTVFDVVTVGVEENIIKGTPAEITDARAQVSSALGKQENVQKNVYGTSKDLDKVIVYNGYVTETTIDGMHYSSDYARQNFFISNKLGFFEFEIEDMETRSPGGNPSFESYGYYFFCNEDFDAHIYKFSDNAKRRCKVNAQDLLGKADRTEVTCLMLDQFFVAGRKVYTNQFENALETEEFDRGDTSSKGGFTNGGQSSVGIYYSLPPQERTVSNSEESDLNMPAGTKYTISGENYYHWSGGRIDSAMSVILSEYDLDGHHYVQTQKSYTRVLLEDEVEITYPNRDDYQEVAGLFDL